MTTWPQATRDDALNQLRNNTTLADVHRNLNGPCKATISNWAKADGINLAERSKAKTREATLAASAKWAEVRLAVANESGDAARSLLEILRSSLQAGTIEVLTVKDAQACATAMAILADKAQLLSGDATSRPELVAPQRTPEQEAEVAAVLSLVPATAA